MDITELGVSYGFSPRLMVFCKINVLICVNPTLYSELLVSCILSYQGNNFMILFSTDATIFSN